MVYRYCTVRTVLYKVKKEQTADCLIYFAPDRILYSESSEHWEKLMSMAKTITGNRSSPRRIRIFFVVLAVPI
jgi:hypothetical protein